MSERSKLILNTKYIKFGYDYDKIISAFQKLRKVRYKVHCKIDMRELKQVAETCVPLLGNSPGEYTCHIVSANP